MKTLRFACIFLPVFGLSYYLLMRSGLSGQSVPTAGEVIFSVPMLLASFLLLGAVSWWLFGRSERIPAGVVLSVAGLAVMAAGYWTSALTRFDVVTVITEGQAVRPDALERVPGSGYAGKYGRTAPFELELVRLHPVFSPDGLSIANIRGEFLMKSAGGEEQVVLSDGASHSWGLMRMRIRDLGYSPRYELRTNSSDIEDSSFVFLRAFPPGREDSFRLLAPLDYYVRFLAQPDSGGKCLLHLRITRNKDIVFDGDVKQGEEIAFENARMRFPEVRKWTMLEITRDYGQPFFWLGALIGASGLVLRCRRYFPG
jgi:hypothetical protein